MSKKIGRFDILRELGRGAQSVVYLARDPHLQREVAIKTLHFSRPDPLQNQTLLEEARTVSQMRHPNIVPIFEAGEEGGDLYLVFEYVPGKNLGEYLRDSGALSPVRAISVMQPVLDAIAHAHALGVIHRDLKPTNILINEDGFARVMDFGIAARVESPKQGDTEAFTGTPAYMAPEYLEHHRIDAQTDVFAAGLVFFELLTGQRAVQGNDVFNILRQITTEDIRLPAEASVDERLSSILYKALERNPERRYASITAMREALDDYLDPEESATSSSGAQGTIEFLLRRMRHKSDFPALSESVGGINKITASDRESVAKLSGSILKDFALTNKILKLVNSAFYRPVGGGNISTVSRAVMVLGFDSVRNIAITVLLFEHLQNKGNANQLKDEFLRANLAGILAKDIGSKTAQRDVEQAFICSMFHNLGRMLTQYYFPEEGEDIRTMVEQKGITEDQASHKVLGISFEEMGIGIAQHWGFPPLIVNTMRRLPPGSVRKATAPEEKLRVLSAFSNELCTIIANATPEQRQKELKKLTGRFGDSVALSEQDMHKTIEKSFEEVAQFASVIQLNLKQTPFGRQIRSWGGSKVQLASGDAEAAAVDDAPDTLASAALVETPVMAESNDGNARPENVEAILTAGIQDISNSLVGDFALNDLLRIILETMFRAKGFRRVILCIKDARANTMQGRFGFGPDATEIAKKFKFPLTFTPDIFHAAMSKGVDILISDINDPKIAARVPEWYRKSVGAGTFVLFPLTIKTNPVAMIYADMEQAGAIVIPEQELSLFRTLRNQAVLAIKQAM
ncbi:MAG: protein kinase [Betaproteobacteria bacterium]|uniref:Protein kinase n=1 Tax=Candidatus Proximibacter danicus TaxID=2954365 RepID=A0A9D7K135_9PROT|nr:protein kinase [Candidatus Proximibacter danicus]